MYIHIYTHYVNLFKIFLKIIHSLNKKITKMYGGHNIYVITMVFVRGRSEGQRQCEGERKKLEKARQCMMPGRGHEARDAGGP